MRSDDPRATLAGIRERSAAALEFPMSGFAEDSIRCCTQSAMDVPLLLGAVEAALKLADGAEPSIFSEDGVPLWWNLDPATIREAITSALAGKEGGDGMEDRPGS